MSGWDAADWIAFWTVFAFTLGVLSTLGVEVRGRRERKRKLVATHRAGEHWTADREEWGTRPSWTQVGALEFVRYGRTPMGGARWELERVIFENTPGGRLAANDFRKAHNVQGPTVLHTRDTGRR